MPAVPTIAVPVEIPKPAHNPLLVDVEPRAPSGSVSLDLGKARQSKAKLMGAPLPRARRFSARVAVPSRARARFWQSTWGVKANTVRAWWLAKPGKQLWPQERLVKVADWLAKRDA